MRRGFVIMEINRQPVADGRRLSSASSRPRKPGDVLAFYVYDPTLASASLVTVTVDVSAPVLYDVTVE